MSKRIITAVVIAGTLGLGACSDDDDGGYKSVTNDPANVDGVQFATQEFEVAQGEEIQDCYFFRVPDLDSGRDLWMNRVRIGVNPGSHHVNVFRVKTIVNLDGEDGQMVHNGECFNSANWADWPLVANNQDSSPDNPYYDWTLPAGVAYRFSPGEKLMVQLHYVNASTQATPYRGKIALDMYRTADAAPMEMGTLFATQQSIRVCQSNPQPSYHGTCGFKNSNVTIAAANGHFHSRGRKFEVFRWDGVTAQQPAIEEKFYESTSWDDPPMTTYDGDSAMQVPAGAGIWWTCNYEWTPPSEENGGCDAVNQADKLGGNDCCYTFGPWVETNEHCNVFLYYYPKVEKSDIACF